MPEEEKKNEPMVDIDTSGPEVEVNLEEETKQEEPKETIKVEETDYIRRQGGDVHGINSKQRETNNPPYQPKHKTNDASIPLFCFAKCL